MNATTGALTAVAGSPFDAVQQDPISIAVDPTGKFAFVATYWGDISAYKINASTGALTLVAGSPFNHSANQGDQEGFHDLAVAPSGKFLYTTRSTSTGSSVLAFAINQTTGALTAAALLGCIGILVHSVLDFNLQIPANAALFYVLCAMAASQPLYEAQRRRVLRRHGSTELPLQEPLPPS